MSQTQQTNTESRTRAAHAHTLSHWVRVWYSRCSQRLRFQQQPLAPPHHRRSPWVWQGLYHSHHMLRNHTTCCQPLPSHTPLGHIPLSHMLPHRCPTCPLFLGQWWAPEQWDRPRCHRHQESPPQKPLRCYQAKKGLGWRGGVSNQEMRMLVKQILKYTFRSQ